MTIDEAPDCEMCEYSPGAIYVHAQDCYDGEDGSPNLCSGTGVHETDCRGSWVPCPACHHQPERVLIYGSRTWRDPEPIRAFVATLPADAVVMHGAQRSYDKEKGQSYGADYFADVAARSRGLTVEPFPAEWTNHVNCRCRSHRGRCLGAGPRRNQQMVDAKPTRARGFRMSGESRGTDDCTRRLVQAGIPHEVITDQH